MTHPIVKNIFHADLPKKQLIQCIVFNQSDEHLLNIFYIR